MSLSSLLFQERIMKFSNLDMKNNLSFLIFRLININSRPIEYQLGDRVKSAIPTFQLNVYRGLYLMITIKTKTLVDSGSVGIDDVYLDDIILLFPIDSRS